jgi:hypothetical protein
MLQSIEERIEQIKSEGYDFSIKHFINKAWELFKIEAGSMIGYCVLLILGFAIVTFIPFIGPLSRALFQTPLMMGFVYVAARLYQNKTIEFSNYFDGIKDFLKILIISLLNGIFILLTLLPAIIFMLYKLTNGFDLDILRSPGNIMPLLQNPAVILSLALGLFLLVLPAFYLSLCMQFSVYFVIFLNADYWKAIQWSIVIVNKKIGHFILMSIVIGALVILSFIPFLLGLLIIIPLSFLIKYVMFHEIVNLDHIDHANRDRVDDFLSQEVNKQQENFSM